MTPHALDELFRPLARELHEGHMQRLGIAPTMRLAAMYNEAKFGRQDAWRRALYRTGLLDLLEENDPCARSPIELKDGWAIDTTGSLPHLDRVLRDSEE